MVILTCQPNPAWDLKLIKQKLSRTVVFIKKNLVANFTMTRMEVLLIGKVSEGSMKVSMLNY